jgi:hypothetical protein
MRAAVSVGRLSICAGIINAVFAGLAAVVAIVTLFVR